MVDTVSGHGAGRNSAEKRVGRRTEDHRGGSQRIGRGRAEMKLGHGGRAPVLWIGRSGEY